jgi:hypothetical protein
VSALSQMWVFALYELLRTWRQRATEVMRWGEELRAVAEGERRARVEAKRQEIDQRSSEALELGSRWQPYEEATNPAFLTELRYAMDKAHGLFKAAEAVRVSLAKHEVVGEHGLFARAPGYGRIHMGTGSIYWPIALGRGEDTIISRRDLADGTRALIRPNDRILPVEIQQQVSQFKNDGPGVKRITATLDDGTEFDGVVVAWNREIMSVQGHNSPPFDAARVVAVVSAPHPEDRADDAPF